MTHPVSSAALAAADTLTWAVCKVHGCLPLCLLFFFCIMFVYSLEVCHALWTFRGRKSVPVPRNFHSVVSDKQGADFPAAICDGTEGHRKCQRSSDYVRQGHLKAAYDMTQPSQNPIFPHPPWQKQNSCTVCSFLHLCKEQSPRLQTWSCPGPPSLSARPHTWRSDGWRLQFLLHSLRSRPRCLLPGLLP